MFVGLDDFQVNDVSREGGILTSANPTERRRLDGVLQQLEKERQKRLNNLKWKQRDFFIKQVFDRNSDLRFVKASERPKYLEGIPRANDDPRRTPTRDTRSPSEVQTKTASSDAISNDAQSQTQTTTNSVIEVASIENKLTDTPSHSREDAAIITAYSSNDCRTSTSASRSVRFSKIDHGSMSSKTDTDQGSSECQSIPSSAREVKFPVIKVRAMGLFAAASKRARRQARPDTESSVPALPPTSARVEPCTDRESTLSIKMSSAPNIVGNACESKSPSLTQARAKVSPSEISPGEGESATNRRRVGEDLFSSPITIRQQRFGSRTSTNRSRGNHHGAKPNTLCRSQSFGAKTAHAAGNFHGNGGSVDGAPCQEKVIRNIVRTLPVKLLIKTSERESEVGSGSAGVSGMKRRMLERCRLEANQRTVDDPRFRNLRDWLAATDGVINDEEENDFSDSDVEF